MVKVGEICSICRQQGVLGVGLSIFGILPRMGWPVVFTYRTSLSLAGMQHGEPKRAYRTSTTFLTVAQSVGILLCSAIAQPVRDRKVGAATHDDDMLAVRKSPHCLHWGLIWRTAGTFL